MTIKAFQPHLIGKFEVGKSRVGVLRRSYADLLNKLIQKVTWRVANTNVDRNATTGIRHPDYSTEHTIYGVLEERGGEVTALPGGFIQRGDAVFTCIDGVKEQDQIYVPTSEKFYRVDYMKEEYMGLVQAGRTATTFCFRSCDLTLLDLYVEAD